MEYRARIEDKLNAGLSPLRLTIKDVSHRHAGHAGHDPRGETHFEVTVVSSRFESLNRVARQRLVYGLLAEELKERVHALQLRTITPEEDTEGA